MSLAHGLVGEEAPPSQGCELGTEQILGDGLPVLALRLAVWLPVLTLTLRLAVRSGELSLRRKAGPPADRRRTELPELAHLSELAGHLIEQSARLAELRPRLPGLPELLPRLPGLPELMADLGEGLAELEAERLAGLAELLPERAEGLAEL